NAFLIDLPRDGVWATAAQDAKMRLQQRKFAEAAESAKRALQIAKAFLPSADRMAVSYFLLGNIYRDWGHCTDARVAYSRAIATWEKQPNPKPKFLFNTIVSLLSTLCECDDFKGADKTF